MGDLHIKDSKQRYHQVCIQFYESSCGPACVAMVERICKHLSQSDEKRARQLSKKYPGKWTIPGGTYPRNLSYVLNKEGVKAYGGTNVGSGGVYSYLKHYTTRSTPVIAMVDWGGPGGAHFIVSAIRDADDLFVFYDPWYGIIERQGWQLPYYKTPDGMGMFNGWLTITKP